MYKVNPDGSIECSTAEEALELQRRIQERAAKTQRQHAQQQQPTLFGRVNGHEEQTHPLGEWYKNLVKRLMEHKGMDISSGEMMTLIDAKTPSGVGPKLYHLRRQIPQLGDLLEERKDEKGIKWWRVRQ